MLYSRIALFSVCFITPGAMAGTIAYKVVKSANRFENIVRRNDLVVVLFIDKDPHIDRRTKDIACRFNRLLSARRYTYAGVRGVIINLGDRHAEALLDYYAIPERPVIMFFGDGEPRTIEGSVVSMPGITASSKIRTMIERLFGKRINSRIKGHNKKQRARAVAQATWFNYYEWAPYSWRSYPGYYYQPYSPWLYDGPSLDFGFSIHSSCR
jgi:hypothetical protein